MIVDKDKQRAGEIGGARRAEILPPERRAEIAKKAAESRWALRPSRATHQGSFKAEFGIDVDCYVLDDVQKTAVISQRGMGAALGLGESGSRLPSLVNSKRMTPYVGQELREKLDKPLIFQAPWAGGNSPPPSKVNGYDVTILIDLCNAVIAAEADGKKVNPSVVKQAHIILSASAKAGIRGLVYALVGYNPTAEEVIEAFKLYVHEEARKYEPQFSDELYAEWYRLYDIPRPEHGRPWHFKYLTVNHVYFPLARSSGRILELLRANKAKGGDRTKKLFQFLSEIGTIALSRHLGRVQEMAEDSADRWEYEAKIAKRFGFEQQLELPIPLPIQEAAAN